MVFDRSTTPFGAGLLTCVLLASACGEDGTPGTSRVDDPATADEEEEEEEDRPKACTREGTTSSCTCEDGTIGKRTCEQGQYTSCDCSPKGDAGKASSETLCKPGYYSGTFKGKYRPGAFGFGLFPSPLEVEIEGGQAFFDDSLPPLAFTLREEWSAGSIGDEFPRYSVGGGCMRGVAMAAAVTQSPFVARLTGSLDCETGRFEGMLDGQYNLVGIEGAVFAFKGPISGQFERSDSSLQDGAWSVAEPATITGEAAGGGEGEWGAKWTAEEAPELTMDPCAAIPVGAGAESDGGVP